MAFAKGDTVVQVVKAPIKGTVAGFQVDQETGTLAVLVSWTDENGDHSRYFSGDEIEAAPAPAAEEPAQPELPAQTHAD